MRHDVAAYIATLHDADRDAAEETSPTNKWKVEFAPPVGDVEFYAVLPGENRGEAWMLGEQVAKILTTRQSRVTNIIDDADVYQLRATPVKEP